MNLSQKEIDALNIVYDALQKAFNSIEEIRPAGGFSFALEDDLLSMERLEYEKEKKKLEDDFLESQEKLDNMLNIALNVREYNNYSKLHKEHCLEQECAKRNSDLLSGFVSVVEGFGLNSVESLKYYYDNILSAVKGKKGK